MPSARSHPQQPQRRTFRGRGGPTDGQLPRPKTPRVRVKYQPPPTPEGAVAANTDIDASPTTNDADNAANNANRITTAPAIIDDAKATIINPTIISPQDEKFLHEIHHLQKRIQNVSSSIQTCRGLSNPSIWRTNCLLPVRNVMKEWRSILMYYCNDRVSFSGDGFSDGSSVPLVDDENGDVGNHCENQDDENDETDENIEMTGNGSNNNIISNNNHHNNNIVPIDKAILFQSTSPTVFNLLQMSMQTGPLVGSNPGYFKRCGGEVAFMAYSFLEEIVELANNNGIGSKNVDGDDNNVHNIGSSLDGEDNGDTTQDEDEHHCKVDEFLDHEEKQNENDGHCNAQGVNTTALDLCDAESNSNAHNDDDDDEDDSSQDSDSHSSQSNSTLETDNNPQSSPPPPPPPTTTTHITSTNNSPFNTLLLQSSKILLTNNLQTTFQFTVKQSQTIHQWMQNAQKAVEKNKNPSKSSNKLQSQKSKKQEKKELKRERQLKKKKKKKQK